MCKRKLQHAIRRREEGYKSFRMDRPHKINVSKGASTHVITLRVCVLSFKLHIVERVNSNVYS